MTVDSKLTVLGWNSQLACGRRNDLLDRSSERGDQVNKLLCKSSTEGQPSAML